MRRKKNYFDFEVIGEGVETQDAICPQCGSILDENGTCSNCLDNNNNNKSGQWWNNFLSGFGNFLGGSSSFVSSLTGKGAPATPQTVVYQQSKNNTGMYIAVGGAILVIVLIIVFSLRK